LQLLLRHHALHSAVLQIPGENLRWTAPLSADMTAWFAT
jgi:hypothetical protein